MGESGQLALRPFDVIFLAEDDTTRQLVIYAVDIEAAFQYVWDGGEEQLDVPGGGIKDVLVIRPSSLPPDLVSVQYTQITGEEL